MKMLNFFIILSVLVIISSKRNKKPKCCVGTEDFGIGLYSTGVSCSDMINCCPSGSSCSSGKCISIKRKRRKRIRNYKNYEESEIKKVDNGPVIKEGDELIKPLKIEKKPSFNGPVKINWKTLTECLKESGSKDQVIKDIINDYKQKQESKAMKKVFSELKNNNPLIIECLNKEEHLVK